MLLAIDTSTAQVGLAFYDGLQVIGEMTWTTRQHHTTELAPALSGLLSRSNLTINNVSALGVAIGPGSFTSLRVGLSLAKGIALARRLPVIGVPTMDIIAAAQPESSHPLAVMVRAGRSRVALGWYNHEDGKWQTNGELRGATVDEIADEIETPTCVAGELTVEERARLARKRANVLLAPPLLCVRRPSILADLAWTRWKENQVNDAASLAPIYLHVAGTPIS